VLHLHVLYVMCGFDAHICSGGSCAFKVNTYNGYNGYNAYNAYNGYTGYNAYNGYNGG